MIDDHSRLFLASRALPTVQAADVRDIRVLDARTGELRRRLTLDPSRDYQPISAS